MKRMATYLRLSLLVLALALSAIALAPAPAEAVKSCEFYCGPKGPSPCPFAPPGIICTWQAN